jgi:hypothetical protein
MENPISIEIRKTFKDAKDARIWEQTVLRRLDVLNRKDFFEPNNFWIGFQK